MSIRTQELIDNSIAFAIQEADQWDDSAAMWAEGCEEACSDRMNAVYLRTLVDLAKSADEYHKKYINAKQHVTSTALAVVEAQRDELRTRLARELQNPDRTYAEALAVVDDIMAKAGAA